MYTKGTTLASGMASGGAAFSDAVSQRYCVVALVGREDPTDWGGVHKQRRNRDVGDVAGTEPANAQAAYSVADSMDLCRAAATRTADCLARR